MSALSASRSQPAAAARAGLRAATAGHLPRVHGIARMDWKQRDGLFDEDPSWTVGVVATWNVGNLSEFGKAREAYGTMREAEVGIAALAACYAVLGRIEYLMLDAIPRLSEDLQLILQKVRIVAPHHARHVLDDERLGVYQVKSASKFFVQRVDAARGVRCEQHLCHRAAARIERGHSAGTNDWPRAAPHVAGRGL